MANNIFVIIFKVSKNNKMYEKTTRKKAIRKRFAFYLRYYKKVNLRMQAEFDYEIQRIIEKLKEL